MHKTLNNYSKDIFLPPFAIRNVVGTLSQSEGWGITQLNVPYTWSFTRGRGITVMVIDTGYTDHPDLSGALIAKKCRSFVRGELGIEDQNGHSTAVCGVIGARDNDFGMVGAAPECSIITVKVLGSDGYGDFQAIRHALEYALKVKPDVVNMSLGTHAYDERMHNLIKELYANNIPIVAAAGNDGLMDSVNYPAKYPEVICVSGFDRNGKPARFNSTGEEVEFSAPAVDIYTTWLNHKYISISGTSFAAPFMSGLIALLLAKHKKQEETTGQNDCKTVEQIRQHLIKYADDKGVVGRDKVWGYGVIDLSKPDSFDVMEAGLPWDKKKFILQEDYYFDSGKRGINWSAPDGWLEITDGVWIIQKGFAWDGCSNVPDGDIDPTTHLPRTYYASLVHDVGYRYLALTNDFPYSRKEIDKFFYSQLKKVHYAWARIYFEGVKFFGFFVLLFRRLRGK